MLIIMKKLGVHLLQRLKFFKGVGLTLEKKSIQETIEAARIMRKHNLMVSVYVGGTIFTHYFLLFQCNPFIFAARKKICLNKHLLSRMEKYLKH